MRKAQRETERIGGVPSDRFATAPNLETRTLLVERCENSLLQRRVPLRNTAANTGLFLVPTPRGKVQGSGTAVLYLAWLRLPFRHGMGARGLAS